MANNLSRLPSRVVTDYSLDTIRPHTFEVALHILHKFPVYFPWGEGGSGDHKAGKALDFPTYEFGEGVNKPGKLRVDMGHQIASVLWEGRKALSVAYIIYRQQIISINPSGKYGPAGQWNGMEDRGDMTANHMDHVHVSFVENPSPFKYTPPEDEKMALSKADIEAVAQRAADLVWFERLKNPLAPGESTPPHASEYLVSIGNETDEIKRRLTSIEAKLNVNGGTE